MGKGEEGGKRRVHRKQEVRAHGLAGTGCVCVCVCEGGGGSEGDALLSHLQCNELTTPESEPTTKH